MPEAHVARPRLFPSRRYLSAGFAALVLAAGGGEAQSLPLFHSINPVAESRSPLYFQPYVPAGPGWRFSVGMDYASLIELGLRAVIVDTMIVADTTYLLDAEVWRLNLAASRNLDARHFVTGEAWVGGSAAGWMDGVLNWYHGLLGIPIPEREHRGLNEFAYRYHSPAGLDVRFPERGFYLGDLRLGLGRRQSRHLQSLLTVTLPTGTGGDGYTREVAGVGLLNTVRVPLSTRFIYEGSAGVGYTPVHGRLQDLQRTTFLVLTSGGRWRMIGGLWTMGNFYVHSPYARRTGATGLDRWEVSFDFGWAVRLGRVGAPELRFGMTEDPLPAGPSVDANFRLGLTW